MKTVLTDATGRGLLFEPNKQYSEKCGGYVTRFSE
jgi:hypothetical protein